MIQAIQKLCKVFRWRKIHGGSSKQASEAPSKTFSDQSAGNQVIQHEYPLNAFNHRTKYGGNVALARKMKVGHYVLCPNRSAAASLMKNLSNIWGKKSGKSKTMPSGHIKVWRQS